MATHLLKRMGMEMRMPTETIDHNFKKEIEGHFFQFSRANVHEIDTTLCVQLGHNIALYTHISSIQKFLLEQ